MEHKKGIDNEFFPDDDFDKMLEEKQRRWQDNLTQSTTEILDSQRPTPQVSDSKVERVGKEPVESVEETSKESTSSAETVDSEEPNKSSDASDVAEVVSDDSEPYVKNGIDTRNTTDVGPITAEEARHLLSNPNYSRDIIEGKVGRIKVQGIEKGPWAKQHIVEETVSSQDAILDKIGQPSLAEFWRRITKAAEHLGDPDTIGVTEKLIHHIDLLQKAAFYQEWALHAYKERLRFVIEKGNEQERKRAEVAYAKMFEAKSRRILPDGETKPKRLPATGVTGEPKPPKQKKETMVAGAKKLIDMLISIGVGQEGIIERFKNGKNPEYLNSAAVEYIREKAKA